MLRAFCTHTCLVLLAAPGSALAEGIEISGTASMGVVGGSHPDRGTRAEMMSDLDLRVRLTRTTDSGLTIGFEYDLDDLDTGVPSGGPFGPYRR